MYAGFPHRHVLNTAATHLNSVSFGRTESIETHWFQTVLGCGPSPPPQLGSISSFINRSDIWSSHPDSSSIEKGVRPCSFQNPPPFTTRRHPSSLWRSSSPNSGGILSDSCTCFCSKELFYGVRLLASRPTFLLSHPGLGPAMAKLTEAYRLSITSTCCACLA